MDATELRKMTTNGESVALPIPASALVILLKTIDLARKRGETVNVEYWAERFIIAGAEAQERTWNYSARTKNDREFRESLERLKINPLRMSPAETVTYCELALRHEQPGVNQDDLNLAKEKLAEFQKRVKEAEQAAAKK